MSLLLLDAGDLAAALPMHRAIDAMSEAFVLLATGAAQVPNRLHLDGDEGATTLVMPGLVPGQSLGAKLVSIYPANAAAGRPVIQGLVVLFDVGTGTPTAVLDGTFLTAWRTGAASGLATRLLAREDARVGAVLGAGPQARTQLCALDAARELEEIRVHGRTRARAEELVADLAPNARATLKVAPSVAKAVKDADVICTATPAEAPILPDKGLATGAHVSAVGSFRRSMRELEPKTIDRARIFVDRVQDATEEAGELIEALERDPEASRRWTELGRVAAGVAEGRRDDDELTLFKSVGNAVQDLVAAHHAVEAARVLGLGKDCPFEPSPLLG